MGTWPKHLVYNNIYNQNEINKYTPDADKKVRGRNYLSTVKTIII